MPDNQTNNKNQAPENIDIVEGSAKLDKPQEKKAIELAPLPEGMEDFNLDTEILKPKESYDELAEDGASNKELAGPGTIVAASQARQRDELRYKAIEKFLSEGLDDMYLDMDMPTRQRFKDEGERTAQAINELLEKGRANAKKLVDIIRKWLQIIPGVNKFFLEQEAKIRADKILNSQTL